VPVTCDPIRCLGGVLSYNPQRLAGIAQLVEQLICNQKVVGSIPIAGTSKIKGLQRCSPLFISGGLAPG
jgi:hypothetical protein